MSKLGAVVAAICLVATATVGLASCGGGGEKEGGTLKSSWASFPDYLDPQISYTAEGWTAMWNTYVPLLTFKHAGEEEGSEVIPGLAEDLPEITNGGKTYTLTLRQGLKYSDGSPVKASDFRFAVERMFQLNSGGLSFYTDIIGAEEFYEIKKGPIPGIKTNDKTGEIVISLVKPRGTFTTELALMFVAPVPQDTPIKNASTDPPPATGPYEIVSSNPSKGWTYERNPQWEKNNSKLMPDLPSGHYDKIEAVLNRNASTQVNDIEQGKFDWMQNPPPADRYAEVRSKYEGTQFRNEIQPSTYYFWMNNKKPPFDDLKVRQAVNYAVDAKALERIYAGTIDASQQILPPGLPGYKKYAPLYPHNTAKAKQLIKEANPSDRDITVWTDNESPNQEAGEYYEDVLKELGFSTKLKILGDDYFTVIGNQSTPDLDTGWIDWLQDYPHPNDFFTLLSGESIQQTNNLNTTLTDIPRLNAKIARLNTKPLNPKSEEEYAALDREFMEQAPWAPYGNRTLATFVSSDIDLDKVIYNPTFAHDLTSFQPK